MLNEGKLFPIHSAFNIYHSTLLPRLFLRPPIIRLAARGADDVVDHAQLAWNLVAGDAGAAVILNVVEGRRRARAELDEGADALAPAFVGDADDGAVEDVRVRLHRRLDLLGEDLLAARVDRDRATAEQGDAAVGLDHRVVAGD